MNRRCPEIQKKKSSIEESLILIQNKYDDFKSQIKEMMVGINSTVEQVDSQFNPEIEAELEIEEEETIPAAESENPAEDVSTDTKEEKEGIIDEKVKGQDKDIIKEEKSEKETKTKEVKEKKEENILRERKKIDIANPDIIENFFKANKD